MEFLTPDQLSRLNEISQNPHKQDFQPSDLTTYQYLESLHLISCKPTLQTPVMCSPSSIELTEKGRTHLYYYQVELHKNKHREITLNIIVAISGVLTAIGVLLQLILQAVS